ncbi:hypothetical protein ABV23_RS00095 [Escherichia coli]|nr:hypothetical protein [Escherichia coli]
MLNPADVIKFCKILEKYSHKFVHEVQIMIDGIPFNFVKNNDIISVFCGSWTFCELNCQESQNVIVKRNMILSRESSVFIEPSGEIIYEKKNGDRTLDDFMAEVSLDNEFHRNAVLIHSAMVHETNLNSISINFGVYSYYKFTFDMIFQTLNKHPIFWKCNE